MPYNKRKQDCTQSDGDKGSYVLSYTDKKGKKRSACHTSKKKMQGQIAAIEGPREADENMEETLEEIRAYVGMLLEKVYYDAKGNPVAVSSEIESMIQAYQKEKAAETERQKASSARLDRSALQGAMFSKKEDAEKIPAKDWMSTLRLAYKINGALPKGTRDLIGNETFRETLANFIGASATEIEDLSTKAWKTKEEGKKPKVDAAQSAMNQDIVKWLNDAANQTLGGERVAARRDDLRQLRDSMKSDGVPSAQVKKVIELTEKMVRTGIGDNFMGQTIRALSQLSSEEVSQLRKQSLKVGDGSIPKTQGFEALFNIAEGSRGENLGRGEILAYYYFDNVEPPDFASGEHDLIVSGVDTHVKNLTGGKESSEYEGIPNKSKDKIMDSPELAADLDEGLFEKFQKEFARTNIAGSNVKDWALKTVQDEVDFKDTPDDELASSSASSAAEGMRTFILQLVENLQSAGRIYAVGESAQCLYFIGGTLTYKMRPAEDMYFYSTDAAATNMTMRKDKALSVEKDSIKQALEELEKLAGGDLEESLIRRIVRENLLLEDLTGSDKSEIKRMIKKELEGPTNRREVDKAFKKNFDKELKKALGSSFFGTPGKINKFVADEIQKEVEKHLGSTANREVVVRICKDVMVKLYRELSFSYKPLIDRMKV